MDEHVKVGKICNGLKRWWTYCQRGDEYDALFTTFCEESFVSFVCIICPYSLVSSSHVDGFDDETLDEELWTKDIDENQFVEFLDDIDDFPIVNGDQGPSTENERKSYFLELLWNISRESDRLFDIIPRRMSICQLNQWLQVTYRVVLQCFSRRR